MTDSIAAPAPATYRNDRILIRPKRGVDLSRLADLHSRLGNRLSRQFPRVGNWQVIELPKVVTVADAIDKYRQSGLVQFAEPDYGVNIRGEPNDFNYWNGDLWNYRNLGQYGGTPGADIRAPEGWDIQNTASNIVVAVVDTGIRLTHEDLAPNLWVNPGETGLDGAGFDKGTNGVDDDADGFIDDVHGINVLLNTGDPSDDHGHGTHVSGTIGAVGNNSVGVAGVAWRVRLMACKFVDSTGNGFVSDAIRCIDYACSKGANIINASWGSYSFASVALQDAINTARDRGILFVAASGNQVNDNDSTGFFPASYPYDNILSVAATDRTDALATFSNYGFTTVDLAAPGDPIFSCWIDSDSSYLNMNGTSTAAPQVAGACALVWAHYPTLTHLEVVKRVLFGVDPLGTLQGRCVSGGRLNLAKTLGPQPTPEVPPLTVWMEDAVPGGAWTGGAGGDTWSWVGTNPTPFSGVAAHQSALAVGIHYHYFSSATETMDVFPGDTLFTYVYLDPDNPPREIMLSWSDSCWEHRAYWGENLIDWGTDGTSNRRAMGGLPALGQWVRLEVPASFLRLEGGTLRGMSFMSVDGRVTWDYSGRSNP